jgi:hypothetical protein
MDAPVNDLSDGSARRPPPCPNCARLQAQVDALREQVRQLRARLDQNSGNSSKPPSSDPPYLKSERRRHGKRRRGGGKPGGRPGHAGHHRELLPPQRVNHVVDHRPDACRACGAALPADARPADPQPRRHQVAEIPPLAAVVTEHRAHGRRCACGQVTFASFPDGVRDHCFGPRLAALASYLSARCHDGKRVVRELLGDAFGVPISLGSVAAKEREVAAALRRPYLQAQRHVRAAAVKHVDERRLARPRPPPLAVGRGDGRRGAVPDRPPPHGRGASAAAGQTRQPPQLRQRQRHPRHRPRRLLRPLAGPAPAGVLGAPAAGLPALLRAGPGAGPQGAGGVPQAVRRGARR